jgi:hypothetical protein
MDAFGALFSSRAGSLVSDPCWLVFGVTGGDWAKAAPVMERRNAVMKRVIVILGSWDERCVHRLGGEWTVQVYDARVSGRP